jgi:DNA repair exonuclease SbcCD ATPase subunit
MDLDDLVRMGNRLGGDFLWFRRNGKTYRVTDTATIGKAEALFAPVQALEPESEELRRKERRLDDRESELDREEELIEEDLEDLDADLDAGMPVDPNARQNLESRRDAVRARMHDLEREQRQLESVERELDAREEKLEAEAEKKLWRLIDEAIASGVAVRPPKADPRQ